MSLRILIVMWLFVASVGAHAAVQIDGLINEDEWAGAVKFDQFVEVVPLSLTAVPKKFHTEAKLLSTPEGIAIAIIADQDISVPRVNSRVQRDFMDQVDRVNFMIDFDADGRAAYDFTIAASNDISDEVITGETQFSKDWDADWQHAVTTSDQGYRYEMLIPWSIASMKPSQNGKRTVAVYFDRVIANTGQRFGTPAASFSRPRFVSDFSRLELAAYEQSLLAITPYATALADLKNRDQAFKTGVDVFWKPNNNHQFALSINPDFGQVESDELVVNFDNAETFFTDKRPFFTDNQAAFESGMPGGDLLYTRRIGGAADDGSGASDINAAVKANGNLGDFGYAVFGASEDGEVGRDFLFLRGAHRSEKHAIDFTQIAVERPFLNRHADVSALHGVFRPNAQWSFNTAIHQSRVEQAGQRVTGSGGGIVADWDMPGPFRQQYFFTQVSRTENLNDLGFQDRNNFRAFEWETGYRQDALAAASPFASHAWEAELQHQANLDGFALRRSLTVQRFSEFRDGGNLFFFMRRLLPGFDDRISRGNGIARIRGGYQAFLEGQRARQDGGNLSWSWFATAFPGRSRASHNFNASVEPRFFLSDQLDWSVGVYAQRWNDWLLWQDGPNLGSFKANRLDLFSNLNWFISDRQELRVKLQAIAIDAEPNLALRIGAGGELQASNARIENFRVRNLGFQIRYRYKLGNLSDVFAVYSRGGASSDAQEGDVFDALGSTFNLRDDDQFLLKWSYRFDL